MFSSNSSQVSSNAVFVEEIFQTYLYTGTGAAQTITNGIDLSTYGGLVWFKPRDTGNNHNLIDSARGLTKFLLSNDINANGTAGAGYGVTSFNTTGFTLGSPWTSSTNTTSTNYVGWTFRKQPKFFDIVTWTSTNSANARISHNLGSVPGCYIIKRTDGTGTWFVYHTSLGRSAYLTLNTTTASQSITNCWGTTDPTSTDFGVDETVFTGGAGQTFVAYLFAHDAGGFGLAGTDNVISCGGFTADGSGNATVSLGYEPQWILTKRTSSATDWQVYDVMRGLTVDNVAQKVLYPNLSSVEGGGYNYAINSTGFTLTGVGGGNTFIYIACRRGPMKVPTLGTSVYTGSLAANNVSVSAGFVPDLAFVGKRDTSGGVYVGSRLQGSSVSLNTFNSTSEAGFGWVWDGPTKTWMQTTLGADVVNWLFARAPSVCDVVCYTGSGSNTTKNHNLGAVPELIILKGRDAATPWACYSASLANTDYLVLRTTAASATDATYWNSTTPTSSVFSIGTNANVNTSAATYVAYLFATLAGVSKVGSYTGNGTTQTIDCGFTGGARWVMIKRTDSTGSWYVYDTARGMTVLTDPYLLMNSNAAEVATLGSVTTVSTGFALNSTILAAINISAGTYIFFAVS